MVCFATLFIEKIEFPAFGLTQLFMHFQRGRSGGKNMQQRIILRSCVTSLISQSLFPETRFTCLALSFFKTSLVDHNIDHDQSLAAQGQKPLAALTSARASAAGPPFRPFWPGAHTVPAAPVRLQVGYALWHPRCSWNLVNSKKYNNNQEHAFGTLDFFACPVFWQL